MTSNFWQLNVKIFAESSSGNMYFKYLTSNLDHLPKSAIFLWYIWKKLSSHVHYPLSMVRIVTFLRDLSQSEFFSEIKSSLAVERMAWKGGILYIYRYVVGVWRNVSITYATTRNFLLLHLKTTASFLIKDNYYRWLCLKSPYTQRDFSILWIKIENIWGRQHLRSGFVSSHSHSALYNF